MGNYKIKENCDSQYIKITNIDKKIKIPVLHSKQNRDCVILVSGSLLSVNFLHVSNEFENFV